MTRIVTVLADYHHHDLWESLELLFDRLSLGLGRDSDYVFRLYRPIGMDWFEQGYWNHERKWHGDAIAKQYLEPWGSDVWTPNVVTGGPLYGYRADASHPGRNIKLLTLEMARDLRPDIVISSLAHNHEGFARFATEVGATFGLQLGNVRFGHIDMAEDRWDLAAFGLVSGIMPLTPPKPHVVYHQEFALRPYTPPPRHERLRVASFVQCYPESPTYDAFISMARRMVSDFDWRVYGAYGGAPLDEYAAGNIGVCSQVGDAMADSDIAWHAKAWSDGFGHVYHQWYALGRPMVGIQSYYANQLGGRLWEEGRNAFDIEHRSKDEVRALLRRFRDDEDFHLRACERAYERFHEVVNYEAEAESIRDLLSQVLP